MSDLLDQYMQADGQEDGKKPPTEPTTLEQVWGQDGSEKYGTVDAEEYQKRITAMDKPELHREAIKRGATPIDDTPRLRKRLVRDFKLYIGSFNKPSVSHKQKPMTAAALKILSEGS